jgi:hypothetical protein
LVHREVVPVSCRSNYNAPASLNFSTIVANRVLEVNDFYIQVDATDATAQHSILTFNNPRSTFLTFNNNKEN